MKRRWIALLAVLTLTGASCSQAADDSGGGTETPAAEEKNSFTVKVDGKSDKFNMEATAYFPSAVSVHPGDKVTFEEVFTGGPHTVTFGTLVDAAAAAVDKLPPGQEEGPPIPEMDKLPDIFGGPPEAGFEPLNQSAGQPCFLATGEPARDGKACEKADQPDFDGKGTFYNSGYLADGDEFEVTFADDIKPGVYNFMCMVHRERMRGKVTVADASTSIDEADEVTKKGEAELAELESKLAPAFEMLKNATPDKAFVGNLAKDANGMVVEFGPKEASIPVGGTMSWTVLSFHTIAINAPEDAINALIKESDGTIKLNPGGAPSKGAPPPVVNLGPKAKAKTVQATYDGAGFFNSGIVASFPENFLTYKVKFTKAGTYDLQCLIHPEMEGKVKVG